MTGTSATRPVIQLDNNSNNNTFSYCNIGGTAANPVGSCIELRKYEYPVNALGTVIDHNNMYDYFNPGGSYAIDFENGGFTITNNKFYQTAARAGNSSSHRAIRFTGSNNATLISNNVIGYANSDSTGSYSVTLPSGVDFTAISANNPGGVVAIQNNTIAGISISGQGRGFTGISLFKGQIYGYRQYHRKHDRQWRYHFQYNTFNECISNRNRYQRRR
ncbi:hypothetical protein [Flavobacterium sp. 3HN19-14]|uniref:hypothetical protein n=1 Tax=Flavobacterium sp. 3HN19-14 TaxID=3448133 RepID=UPI003EE0E3B6